MSNLVHTPERRVFAVGLLACLVAAALLLCAPAAQASGYKNVGALGEYQFTNGKLTFLMERNSITGESILEKVNAKNGTVTDLHRFPSSDSAYWHVSYVYGNTVFVTRSSFEDFRYDTYACNIKTGKLKKVKDKCSIAATSGGKYVVGQNTYRTDVGPCKYTLYQVYSSGKMKAVKVLAKHGQNPTMSGKYIYYASGTSNLSKLSIYKCKENGAKAKKLGGPWKGRKNSWGGTGIVLIPKVTAKYCLVSFEGSSSGHYKYTYKTKKLTKLSDSKFISIISK